MLFRSGVRRRLWSNPDPLTTYRTYETGDSSRNPPLTAHRLPLTYAVKLVPHPHPPVAFGLWNVKPEPCIEVV